MASLVRFVSPLVRNTKKRGHKLTFCACKGRCILYTGSARCLSSTYDEVQRGTVQLTQNDRKVDLFSSKGDHRDSIFANWVNYKEWHDPNFLAEASVEEKEAWLRSLFGHPAEEELDAEAYLVVLRALATSRLPDAALRAERLLQRLERRPNVRPNPECYQRVIEAWANATKEDPALVVIRAERWLLKHIDSENESLRPNTACFNAFLDACSKGRGFKQSRQRDLVRHHAQKAESTLRYMVEQRKKQGPGSRVAPDVDSFNYLIRAWTRCRRSTDIADQAMHALRILEDYQKSVDPNVHPNSKSYAMVMDAIAIRAKHKVKRCRFKKQVYGDDPSMNGFNEIQILTDIIRYMRDKADAGEHYLAPCTQAYNMLISCWGHLSPVHANAPHEAEKVLQQMIRFKDGGADEIAPDAVSYQMVMRAWVNSCEPNRGQRVEWWLSKQWKDFDFEGDDKLQPTTDTYNAVIRTWGALGEPKKAEIILSELIRRSEKDTSGRLSVNSESYCSIVSAWLAIAENGSVEALKMAIHWLNYLAKREEEETGLVCPIHLYSGVLGAARKSAAHSPSVLKLSIEVFERLRSSHRNLDCVDYSRLLQVGLLALSRSEQRNARTTFVMQLVKDCCDDGLLSNALLRALANGPVYYDGWTIEESSRLVEELFPDWPLPKSWMRNVKPEVFLPRRSDLQRKKFQMFPHGDNPFQR